MTDALKSTHTLKVALRNTRKHVANGYNFTLWHANLNCLNHLVGTRSKKWQMPSRSTCTLVVALEMQRNVYCLSEIILSVVMLVCNCDSVNLS
jgi:hypothetical protein